MGHLCGFNNLIPNHGVGRASRITCLQAHGALQRSPVNTFTRLWGSLAQFGTFSHGVKRDSAMNVKLSEGLAKKHPSAQTELTRLTKDANQRLFVLLYRICRDKIIPKSFLPVVGRWAIVRTRTREPHRQMTHTTSLVIIGK